MSSRLDRLFVLLENGGSGVTRKAAAYQLGDIVRMHPSELRTLLDRLHLFITSKSWETRIAAAQAVEAIIKNMPKWDPIPVIKEENGEVAEDIKFTGQLSLQSFSIKRVLEKGSYLLGADESQFEIDEESKNLDPKERTARQRFLVNQRLGLDIAAAIGIQSESIISNKDLTPVPDSISAPKESVAQIINAEMASAGLPLSSRELNRAKRKAKLFSKQRSYEPQPVNSIHDEGPEHKKMRLLSQENSEEDEENFDSKITDQKNWPLEDFCEQLCLDLFSCSWETRHGAATALREVVTLQGECAAKSFHQTATQMDISHQRWLEDKAVRLVCVLALDRFGDFLADQVVAPVRETCAQVLGGVIHHLQNNFVLSIMSLLLEMLSWPDWGTRHGGLLGLKYLLAVKVDLRMKLLSNSFQYVYLGLQDEMDDVVAVAATCLVPVAEDLSKCLDLQETNKLITTLCDALLEIDELTASTNSILLLLAKLLSISELRNNYEGNFEDLIVRIFPFLYHSNSVVRLSALKTIETLSTCPSTSEGPHWIEKVLEPLLIHTYQRSLLENSPQALELVIKIWSSVLTTASIGTLLLVTCKLISSWFCLMMTNHKVPLDSSLLVIAQHNKIDSAKKLCRSNELGSTLCDRKLYIGNTGSNFTDHKALSAVAQARLVAAKLLGNLSHYVSQPMPNMEYQVDETPILCYIRLLLSHLHSRSGMQRLGAGLIIREWALQHPSTLCHTLLKTTLTKCVSEVIYYEEITWSFTRLQQDTKDFIAMLKHYKVEVDSSYTNCEVLPLDKIRSLCESLVSDLLKLRKKVSETLDGRRKAILNNIDQTSNDQIKLNTTIQSVLAGALVRFNSLPEKLNPVIKPLIECIKREQNYDQQKMAASDLTVLMKQIMTRDPCPNGKVIKNLASFLCVDEDFTPNILNENSTERLTEGILSLSLQEKLVCTHKGLERSNSVPGARGPGRPPLKTSSSTDVEVSTNGTTPNPETKQRNQIQRRGCTMALISIVECFSEDLNSQIPQLSSMIVDPFTTERPIETVDAAQNIINWLQFLEIIIPSLHPVELKKFDNYYDKFDQWLYHKWNGVRHMASRVIATLAYVSQSSGMTYLIKNVLQNFSDMSSSSVRRRGAIECVYVTIEKLGLSIVPYIVLLIVPLLGRMSDHIESVRLLATQCFATLIKLFPLDGESSSSSSVLSDHLVEQRLKEKQFLNRLLDPNRIEDYKIPVSINAQLRSYQQRGVNWLAFLNQYNLHGILCDDMGLGKTLQSICILAADHHEKEAQIKEGKNVPKVLPCSTGVQSLVVCPPTLTGHWFYELQRFVCKDILNPLHYTGVPNERKRLQSSFAHHNVIIASYKIIRNEIDFFSKINWNYIILDEGHVIKNGKTKSSKAIKLLVGSHRLILSGTPIQNNVLELWSLFDFLMPGFLGTERQFIAKYSRPILQSRESKSSSKEQEAGVLAMEALHRQVLPFLLRRVKEDVLKDLPPKITQDYYCDLSPLQQKLYEDFSQTKMGMSLDQSLNGEPQAMIQGHVFQALQYLRRVCNHPKLVLTTKHPRFDDISKQLKVKKSSLADIDHAAKLPALKQLLIDCGIGVPEDANNVVVSPHRALIFCQLKGMLDIIEKDLFKNHLPSVTYLRLDGSVPAGSRQGLVERFNSDPSIDVLLLTTQVGGLGLNLTGADTVIFVEHDWNPMRDLQAMDRAHRIGQRRVVNVYRLITKGTLEEKIMSYQKFKLMTANSIISEENSSLRSMGTDQVLDLFTLNSNEKERNSSNGNSNSVGSIGLGVPSKVLEELPALWDPSAYENEYNLDNFVSSLS